MNALSNTLLVQFIICTIALTALARAQTTSNGTGGGNWADPATWSNGLIPTAGNGPFTVVPNDLVIADGNFNFPDNTSLKIDPGAVLELEYLPGGVQVNPIDPANEVLLNGGVIRTAISDPDAGQRGFNPGFGGLSATGGLEVVADSAIENAFHCLIGGGGRRLNINRGGLAIDPDGAGPVTLTIDLDPPQVLDPACNRSVAVTDGVYAGGPDDTIVVLGGEALDQFVIGGGTDVPSFEGTVRALGGARYRIQKNGYVFAESVILGDGSGATSDTRSDLSIGADNVVIDRDVVIDNESGGRINRVDPAYIIIDTADGVIIASGTTIDDWIGLWSGGNGNSSPGIILEDGTIVGGLTDLVNAPNVIGSDPRDIITIGTPGAPSVAAVSEDAYLEGSLLRFEVFGNGTNDALDGASAGTLQLGETGLNVGGTPFPAIVEVELKYDPAIGDYWDLFTNWGLIDCRQLDVSVVPNGHTLPAGATLEFAVLGGTGRVTVAGPQTFSNGTGGGNWALAPTWENNMIPAAANGPFAVRSGDVVVADGNFNFPDATSLKINRGAVLELEYLPGGVQVNPIDPADEVLLNGGVIRTATSDPDTFQRGFNPGFGGLSASGGLKVVADSAIENAFHCLSGGDERRLNINRGGLAIDPDGAGPVTLTIDLDPPQALDPACNRRVAVTDGVYAGGPDDTIVVLGGEAADQFVIGSGTDLPSFEGTVGPGRGAVSDPEERLCVCGVGDPGRRKRRHLRNSFGPRDRRRQRRD